MEAQRRIVSNVIGKWWGWDLDRGLSVLPVQRRQKTADRELLGSPSGVTPVLVCGCTCNRHVLCEGRA